MYTIILSLALMIGGMQTTTFESENESFGPCQDLVVNCRATADQEYANGNYSLAIWDMFYNSICPNAGLDCIFDEF